MISRRSFLKASIAAASGLVLPSWLVKAENFVSQEERPYLEGLKTHRETLYAFEWDYGGYALSLGQRPDDEPDLDLTWEQFIENYDIGQETFDRWIEEEQVIALKDKVDPDMLLDYWIYEKSPIRKAYHFLESIDLGPDLGCQEGGGGIRFYNGFSPMHDAQYAAAADDITLSLLQKRLNDVSGKIAIELTRAF